MSAGAFSFRADDWRDISHDAKDLIKKLLKKTVKVPPFWIHRAHKLPLQLLQCRQEEGYNGTLLLEQKDVMYCEY